LLFWVQKKRGLISKVLSAIYNCIKNLIDQ
jgi:hypothetical protein